MKRTRTSVRRSTAKEIAIPLPKPDWGLRIGGGLVGAWAAIALAAFGANHGWMGAARPSVQTDPMTTVHAIDSRLAHHKPATRVHRAHRAARREPVAVMPPSLYALLNPAPDAPPTLGPGHRIAAFVTDASDGTSANGATWGVYWFDDPSTRTDSTSANDAVGAMGPGAIVAQLDCGHGCAPQIGDRDVIVAERELSPGTPDHRGFYAVTDGNLTASDLDYFAPASLREIPAPKAQRDGNYVIVSWQPVGGGFHPESIVAGYNVFRTEDGVTYGDPINEEPIQTGFFIDRPDQSASPYQYAIQLVYARRQGTPNRNGVLPMETPLSSVLSANSASVTTSEHPVFASAR